MKQWNCRSLFLMLVCGVVAVLTMASTLIGQVEQQRQRLLDEPFRLALDEQVPVEKRVLFDYGGWFRSSYFGIDESVDRDFDGRTDPYRSFRQQQLRLWGSLNLDNAHRFYTRMKMDILDWNSGTSYNGRDYDLVEPKLERFWYQFRLSQAQWAYGHEPGDFDLDFKIGREYVELGTGLVMSAPLDMITATGFYGDFRLRALGAMSIPSTHNIDRSIPGDSKESRHYWALQLNYDRFAEHEPFIYYMNQSDQDDGRVVNNQTFGYDSQYIGLGSRGRFFHKNLQYSTEYVQQFGSSHAWALGGDHEQTIQAWALDNELRYIVPDAAQTQFSAEYLIASGDGDRRFSPTNTRGGNRPHTTDTSFSAWGFRNTGLVFAPRMSNLHMVRLGASSYLLHNYAITENLRFGSDVFFYHKHQSEGAVSDSLSTERHGFLGSEVDVYLDWQLTSDLAWTLRYGAFWPGNAFESGRDRQLVFTGMTLNF